MKKTILLALALVIVAVVAYMSQPQAAMQSQDTFTYTTASTATDTTLTVPTTLDHWQVIAYDADAWVSGTAVNVGTSAVASAAILVNTGNDGVQFTGRFSALAIDKTASGVVVVIGTRGQ